MVLSRATSLSIVVVSKAYLKVLLSVIKHRKDASGPPSLVEMIAKEEIPFYV
jgi:hypothetical protein